MRSVRVLCLMFAVFLLARADIFEKNRNLGKGVNLGNTLEAPTEGSWGEVLDSNYFKIIADQGFQTVRIPIKWSTEARTAVDSPYTINETFFSRVDLAINCARKNNLNAVINIHHYDTLFTNPTKEWERFKAIWKQIAERYKNYPDSLYFEILNEPNTKLTPALWNNLLSETFTIIRETNPTRPVIIGIAEWGGIGALQKLVLPNDPNVILTIHYYEPFHFTHQGASWVDSSAKWIGTKWSGTYFEKLAVTNSFDYARSYAQKHNVPIFVGEFGSGNVADSLSRYTWTSFCARLFEKYDFSWAYWAMGTTFAAYDNVTKKWNDAVANALMSTDTNILAMSIGNVATDLLKNSAFADTADTTYWKFGVWDSTAKATGSFESSGYKVTIDTLGPADWNIQLFQKGLTLQKGHDYAFIFDAYADGERTIGATVDKSDSAWTNYGNNYDAMIFSTKSTICVPFSMTTTDTNARVCFTMGADSTTVHFSKVHLYDLGLTTAVKRQLHLTTKTALPYLTKVVGKSIVLSFNTNVVQPVSVVISNLSGRVVYEAKNVAIGSSKCLVIPFGNKTSTPMILQVKGDSFSGSELLQNVK